MPLFNVKVGVMSRGQPWRGIGVAVAAAVLALLGLVLSFVQSERLLSQRRQAQAAQARALGRLVYLRFTVRLDAELDGILSGEDDRAASPAERQAPSESARLVQFAQLWDGRQFQPTAPQSAPPDDLLEAAATVLSSTRLAPPQDDDESGRQFLNLRGRSFFLVIWPTGAVKSEEAPGATALRHVAFVNKSAFRALAADVASPADVAPPADSGLRVAEEDRAASPWSSPLPGSLNFWSFQPTPEAMRADADARWRQILLLGPVSMVSMIALVGLIWRLSRVVREEEELSRLQGDFVAGVSHELKTPLALIHLFGETLLEGRVSGEEKKREYYDIIVRESTRLTHLIDNVLDFSKLQSGGKMFELTVQDVGSAVRSIYDAYRHELEHAHMRHSLTLAENLPPVAMDRDAIGQAVLNLMSNAVKYADDEKEMTIEVTADTRRGRHGVLISVHDRGIGISPEDRARVFDGFFRANDPLVRKRRGTGLGLSLVRHVVESHGGSVSVESRLSKGTTFRIFLPAAQEQLRPTATP
ncbi:MAG: HAMP domain-containing histidine kinase [Phycisphaerales bacterium]|nr:HAMP domain-containing histidine kinase [Phycisphaerales bacterium]